MPSPAESPGDRGLARERTALSWQRMALSFTSLAGVTLAAAAHRHRPWLLAPAAALAVVGAAIWLYARQRIGDPGRTTERRPIALLAAAVILAALGAALLAAVPTVA
jgi:uncharacterized membrane protein YidH (DUF202 family)